MTPTETQPSDDSKGVNGGDIVCVESKENIVMAERDSSDEVRSVSSEQDNETVREKLKQTTIDPSTSRIVSAADNATGEQGDENMQLSSSSETKEERRSRKRSHDESDEDNKQTMSEEDSSAKRRSRAHERKRSREIPDADRIGVGSTLSRVKTPPTHPEESEGIAEIVANPRVFDRKRSLGRLDKDPEEETDQKKKISRTDEDQELPKVEEAAKDKEASTSEASGETSRLKLPATSGFGNTSTKSPFATSAKDSTPLFGAGGSSSNLFSNSKFGAMSGSSASPFGSLGGASVGQSPFGALGAKSTGSPFGLASGFGASTTTASPFASAKSSSFGSAFGVSSGSTFASLTAKSSTVKPFGAPDTDEDKSDEEGTDIEEETNKIGTKTEDDKMAPGFQEQELHTGEENEDTIFKGIGKAYFFEGGVWKERGRGTIKLNKSNLDDRDDEKGGKESARLIMRTDGTLTLIFNSPIFKGMTVKDLTNTAFTTTLSVDGKFVTARIKLRNAQQLHNSIQQVQNAIHGKQ